MGLWLLLGLMTLLAVGLVVGPLVRRGGLVASRRDYDLRVYRAQLAELAREQERGVLGEREAGAARLEVERRMLAADVADRQARQAPAWSGRHWVGAVVLLCGLPALAGGLYRQLGTPNQPAAPFAERAGERAQLAAAQEREQEALRSIETMIARLAARLESDPDDLEASLRLGRAYALAGRFERAATTYRDAIARHEGVAELHSALGETLVMASAGTVGGEARAAFDEALELDAGDVRARFYTGLALLQRGEQQGALDAWVSLLENAPADAPWLPDLRRRTAALAEDLGLDPERAVPAGPPGIAAEGEVDTAAARAAAARLAAQLAANPKDYQGWIRLAQAWARLGEPAQAQDALRRGAEAYPGAPFVQQQFQTAAAELGIGRADGTTPRGPTTEQMRAAETLSEPERQEMIRGMVEGLAVRLEQQPDDIAGWRMLGRSWAALGHPAKSAEAYAQVASRLPDDVTAQVDYAEALLAQQSMDQPPSPEVVAQLQHVLALDGDNPIALFHLGRAAAARGDTAAAARHWQRLLAQLPAHAPVRTELERLLENLHADG
jgi:cytochrome c-type biogenesis protein CcmH